MGLAVLYVATSVHVEPLADSWTLKHNRRTTGNPGPIGNRFWVPVEIDFQPITRVVKPGRRPADSVVVVRVVLPQFVRCPSRRQHDVGAAPRPGIKRWQRGLPECRCPHETSADSANNLMNSHDLAPVTHHNHLQLTSFRSRRPAQSEKNMRTPALPAGLKSGRLLIGQVESHCRQLRWP